jgi:hypothetical protein
MILMVLIRFEATTSTMLELAPTNNLLPTILQQRDPLFYFFKTFVKPCIELCKHKIDIIMFIIGYLVSSNKHHYKSMFFLMLLEGFISIDVRLLENFVLIGVR